MSPPTATETVSTLEQQTTTLTLNGSEENKVEKVDVGLLKPLLLCIFTSFVV